MHILEAYGKNETWKIFVPVSITNTIVKVLVCNCLLKHFSKYRETVRANFYTKTAILLPPDRSLSLYIQCAS